MGMRERRAGRACPKNVLFLLSFLCFLFLFTFLWRTWGQGERVALLSKLFIRGDPIQRL